MKDDTELALERLDQRFGLFLRTPGIGERLLACGKMAAAWTTSLAGGLWSGRATVAAVAFSAQ